MCGCRASGIAVPWLIGRREGRGRRRRRLVRVIRGGHDVVHPWLWLGHVSCNVRVVVSASSVQCGIGMVLNGHTT